MRPVFLRFVTPQRRPASDYAATAIRRGFTLIELSIVLVIIGLIVGGVLVGQTLVASAAIRAQVSQIEKFNTATATFYGKFGALPGDISSTQVARFGFSAAPSRPELPDRVTATAQSKAFVQVATVLSSNAAPRARRHGSGRI